MKRTAIAAALLLAACSARAQVASVQDGDIVFQTSKSAQSLAIQRATHSPYSHMGIILFRGGKPFVFEAVETVRYTPLDVWIARGEGARFVVKRLKKTAALTSEVMSKIRARSKEFEGCSYDLTFEWSDRRTYCSELVWKLYDSAAGLRIGELQHLRDLDLTDSIVRAKLKERYGSAIPMDEPVISPAAMFESPLLETVSLEAPGVHN